MMKVDRLGLEDIIDIAKKAGYKPTSPELDDVGGLLKESQFETMLIRFAYLLEKRLNDIPDLVVKPEENTSINSIFIKPEPPPGRIVFEDGKETSL